MGSRIMVHPAGAGKCKEARGKRQRGKGKREKGKGKKKKGKRKKEKRGLLLNTVPVDV
ncbi:MAG: hypothetical protein ACRD2K_01805 [Terriglobales bacterium]